MTTWQTFDINSWLNLSISDWLSMTWLDATNIAAILSPSFKTVGKMIAIRRLAQHETLRTGSQYTLEDLLAEASAQVAKDGGYDAFTDNWLASFQLMNHLTSSYSGLAIRADNSILQYLRFMASTYMGVSPNLSFPLVAEGIVAYMNQFGLSVPSGDGGFYDYFAAMYHDRHGEPIELPVSPSGTFGPGWVTTELIL